MVTGCAEVLARCFNAGSDCLPDCPAAGVCGFALLAVCAALEVWPPPPWDVVAGSALLFLFPQAASSSTSGTIGSRALFLISIFIPPDETTSYPSCWLLVAVQNQNGRSGLNGRNGLKSTNFPLRSHLIHFVHSVHLGLASTKQLAAISHLSGCMATLTNPTAPETQTLAQAIEQIVAETKDRPLSTYRLQFHKDFRLEHARELVEYLHDLGISHLYASPVLEARTGSMHGYDIISHERLNPEVGTEDDLRDLVRELNARGMSIVLDIVPNHMGVSTATPWWRDVLQHGRASQYAAFFDIDWNPLKPELRNRLLLPLLGDQYGEELEQGHLQVRNRDGELVVQYYAHDFPIDPQSLPLIFDVTGRLSPADHNGNSSDVKRLAEVLEQLRALPPHSSADPEQVDQRNKTWNRLRPVLISLFQQSDAVKHILDRALERINGKPGESTSFDLLHLLLELQVYRLAHWRVSGEEINYRRFFDVNDLVGLRMENPHVFAETHRLLRRMIAERLITGVRIDHCDGMLNPRQYLIRLQLLYTAARINGAEPAPPLADNGIALDIQRVFTENDWMYRKHPL